MTLKFNPKKDIVIIVKNGIVADYRIPENCTITIITDDESDNDLLTEEDIKAAKDFARG